MIDKKLIQAAVATGATLGGSVLGAAATSISGMSAVGVVGGGTGFGAAAGPVGMAAGAITGLAIYGVVRIFAD